jgi:MoaA/NifB/PqqE/SkfB family radical SAM enzyme
MFELDSIKTLHLETSSVCNAACPMCSREVDINFNKDTDPGSLSLDKVKQLFDEPFIQNLEYMFMCGSYGDPAAAPDCIKIFKHFRSINNSINFGMHSNGGLRNKEWWSELGSVLSNPFDACYFGIDGLSDTNHIHRVNVSFDKVMENAEAFITAGGRAHWEFLVFDYNEHQVDKSREIAKSMGFVEFRTKVSHRLIKPTFNHLRKVFNPPKGKEYQ